MGRPGSGESVGGHRAVRRRTPVRSRSDLCGHHGHRRRPDRGGARNGGAALVLRYPGWRVRGWTLHRVDLGRAARDSAPHPRAPVVAARRGRDFPNRVSERRADTLSRWLVNGRQRGRDVRARSGRRIPLDRGTALVHVRLDRRWQHVPAAVRQATRIARARGGELAQGALPGAPPGGVHHARRAIPQVSARAARRRPVGTPGTGIARRQPSRAVPDARRPRGRDCGRLERLATGAAAPSGRRRVGGHAGAATGIVPFQPAGRRIGLGGAERCGDGPRRDGWDGGGAGCSVDAHFWLTSVGLTHTVGAACWSLFSLPEVTMGKINWGRVVLGGLLAGGVRKNAAFLTYGVWLKPDMAAAMAALGKSPAAGDTAIPLWGTLDFGIGIGRVG